MENKVDLARASFRGVLAVLFMRLCISLLDIHSAFAALRRAWFVQVVSFNECFSIHIARLASWPRRLSLWRWVVVKNEVDLARAGFRGVLAVLFLRASLPFMRLRISSTVTGRF